MKINLISSICLSFLFSCTSNEDQANHLVGNTYVYSDIIYDDVLRDISDTTKLIFITNKSVQWEYCSYRSHGYKTIEWKPFANFAGTSTYNIHGDYVIINDLNGRRVYLLIEGETLSESHKTYFLKEDRFKGN